MNSLARDYGVGSEYGTEQGTKRYRHDWDMIGT